jgi:hypothetical protein
MNKIPGTEKFSVMFEALKKGKCQEFNRKSVLHNLGRLVHYNYLFSLSPLPHLRIIFPQFKWESTNLHKLSGDDFRAFVKSKDILFYVHDIFLNQMIVTAEVIGDDFEEQLTWDDRTDNWNPPVSCDC